MILTSWCDSDILDIISPQLYSTGIEGYPDFDETYNCKAAGCTWEKYVRKYIKYFL